MFIGGGLNEATAMVKQNDGAWLLDQSGQGKGRFDGLECRWCAVPARRDGVLSLIVHAPGEDLALYQQILTQIGQIAPQPRPVTPENLPTRWPPEFLMHEFKIKQQGWLTQRLHYLGALLLTGVLTVLVKLTKHNAQSAAARYIRDLCHHTDYLKLDDYLRMVIDVSHQERSQIQALLDTYRHSHGVTWGSHFASSALFTCMVRSQQVHLHFVDGSDGGYTAAARDMDARLNAATFARLNRRPP
jgi:hypothetical protein